MTNFCEERHTPKFKIKYKGSVEGSYHPTWLVCPNCLENKPCFGDRKNIVSMIEI